MVCQGGFQTRFRPAAGPSSSEAKLARWAAPVGQWISVLLLAMRWAERPRWRVGRMESFCFFILMAGANEFGNRGHCTVLCVAGYRHFPANSSGGTGGHPEERVLRRRISSMLPRQYLYDRDAFDVMAGAELYWMRFFAALRMTAGFACRPHERRRSKITKEHRESGRRGAK